MKKTFFSICVLLAFACGAFADDTFSVDHVTLPQNGEADVVVRFSLDDGSTCSGYTFWLQVPNTLAFVTYEKNEKTYITYNAGDCYDETPTITPNIDGGYLKVGCLTANSDPVNGPTGTLVTFRLKVVGTVNVGDVLTGTLTKGTISAENGTVHNVADATFAITIAAPADMRAVLDETSTTAPTAATGMDVRLKRTTKANEWSTICLPFAMTAEQVKAAFGDDVELGDFTGYDTTEDAGENIVGITVNFAPVTAIEANHPYIIKVKAAVSAFTVDGVNIAPEDVPCVALGTTTGKGKNAVYHPMDFTGTYVADFDFYNDAQRRAIFLNGNKFYYATENTKHMKAFRAYFDFDDVLSGVESESSRISMSFDHSTGISEIVNSKSENSKYYDLQGRCVAEPQKGLYIKDGKKVVKK